MAKVSTSLMIDENTYRKFKLRCVELDLEFSEGMEKALKEWSK